MNLRRQLLLVSLLTLVLPWAGCQFIRETETALREGQQNMMNGTALAIADSLSQFPADFLEAGSDGIFRERQIYGHPLGVEPLIDGYSDDWTVGQESARVLRGTDGENRFTIGIYRQHLYLFAEIRDASTVYARSPSNILAADHLELLSVDAEGNRSTYLFGTEAPGALIGRRLTADGVVEESRIDAIWRDTPVGYSIEARVPRQLIGEYLGLIIANVDAPDGRTVRSASFNGTTPGRFITISPLLTSVIGGYVQPDLRLIVTDRAGWRLAIAGDVSSERSSAIGTNTGLLRVAYNLLLEPGEEAALAEPNPSGRERETFVVSALGGEADRAWFRSADTGRAVVAVAQPVWSGNVQTGAVILQQGTAAILSLTNTALGRLLTFTLIATLGVAAALIGYASWLSLRIRRLSEATGQALDREGAPLSLPSALANDEVGDLSRSFSDVLRQLGNYNEYLRSLASKLSHELRTPLTIVSSSLENLEHEALTGDAADYTARARDGAARLKKILDAMSEASRVEELMMNIEPETFDLSDALRSATAAYDDAWADRRFHFVAEVDRAAVAGSPELVIQMLDKLVDNAYGFTEENDEILIRLADQDGHLRLSVFNPGPPLPDTMRHQLFDSMVSVRPGAPGEHLGLGLYIARLIAEGHGGNINAENTDDGVVFHIYLPTSSPT